MSEDFDLNTETKYSAFWPLLILLIALLIWTGYQDWAMNKQRSVASQQLEAATPTINQAQNVEARYKALMEDLIQTSQKDPAAADIVKAAIQAGLIRIQNKDTNATTNPAPPPPAK
jgi:predicted negative regulator of RcsB-dependent stress response